MKYHACYQPNQDHSDSDATSAVVLSCAISTRGNIAGIKIQVRWALAMTRVGLLSKVAQLFCCVFKITQQQEKSL